MTKPKKKLSMRNRAKLCNALADHIKNSGVPLDMGFWFDAGDKYDDRDEKKSLHSALECKMPMCVGGRIPLIEGFEEWSDLFYQDGQYNFVSMCKHVVGIESVANLNPDEYDAYRVKYRHLFDEELDNNPDEMAKRLRNYAKNLNNGKDTI